MLNGKIHYKWPFSIAMLVYQRVMDDDNPKYIGWYHPQSSTNRELAASAKNCQWLFQGVVTHLIDWDYISNYNYIYYIQ